MSKTLSTIIAASVLALGLGACTAEQKMHYKNPGSYESTETNTDAKGTTTVKTSTTEVTIDENGHRQETITSKTSRDPVGLGNKTTTNTKKTTVEK